MCTVDALSPTTPGNTDEGLYVCMCVCWGWGWWLEAAKMLRVLLHSSICYFRQASSAVHSRRLKDGGGERKSVYRQKETWCLFLILGRWQCDSARERWC